MTTGEIVRFLREKRGLSGRQLSVNAGLSASYVSKVELGQIVPTLEAFGKIMRALGATDKEIYVTVLLASTKDAPDAANITVDV